MRTATRGVTAGRALLGLAVFVLITPLATVPSSAQKYLPTSDYSKAVAIPEPMELEWKTGKAFLPTSTTALVTTTGTPEEVRRLAAELKATMMGLFGIDPQLMNTDLIPEKNVIIICTLQDSVAWKGLLPGVSGERFGRYPDQGYALSVTPERVMLVGGNVEGVRYGIQTLLQLVTSDPVLYARVVPSMEIVDFPSVEMRALLLPFGSYKQLSQMESIRELINIAQALHMNTVMLQVDNATKFDSAPAIARPGATPKDTLRAIVEYARDAGLEVIPLVYTLSQQTSLLCTGYPSLCIDKSTYDPSNPKVYEKLFGILDEVIDVVRPRYLHIGHDKVLAFARLPEADARRLFLSDVMKIYEHLKSKGVGTMMWSDMLIHSQNCRGQDNCRGSIAGIHTVLDSLPRDIVLVDAHYRQRTTDYPSMDYLLSKGFSVLGCIGGDTLSVNSFSKYAAGRNDRAAGMVLALWEWSRYELHGTPTTLKRMVWRGAEAFWRGGIPPEDPTSRNMPEHLRDNRY